MARNRRRGPPSCHRRLLSCNDEPCDVLQQTTPQLTPWSAARSARCYYHGRRRQRLRHVHHQVDIAIRIVDHDHGFIHLVLTTGGCGSPRHHSESASRLWASTVAESLVSKTSAYCMADWHSQRLILKDSDVVSSSLTPRTSEPS